MALSKKLFVFVKLSLCLQLLFFCMVSNSFASAVGLPQSTLKYGFATQAGYYSVKDPEGTTDQAFLVQPFNFIVSDWLPNGSKYWVEAYYSSLAFDAETDSVGQQVQHLGSKLGLLYNFSANRYWHPWAGAGMDLSYTKYSKRHLINEYGYLAKRLDNRSNANVALLLNIAAQWQASSTWQSGLKAEYRMPIGQNLQSMTMSVYFLFR